MNLKNLSHLKTPNPQQQKGLTLIEIMVVLVILTIMATVVGVNVMGSLSSSKVKTTKIQLKSIEGALKLYQLDNNRLPNTGEGLDALITPIAEAKNFPSGGYLDSDNYPVDGWDNDVQYVSDGRTYELFSLGADGMEGGEEADADINSK